MSELINRLIAKGLITEKQVREAKREIVTGELKQTLEGLHLMYCELDHDTGQCQWYAEDHAVNTWEMESHQRWVRSFNSFRVLANSPKLVPEGVSENTTSSTDN